MNLTEIAKKILSEDSWGNAPSAAAPSEPGASPTANSPAPQSSMKFFDVQKDYQLFQTTIDSQEEKAKKVLDSSISKSLLNKEVTARASKGAVGQVEKDYTFTVVGVDVTYLKDKYFIILKGDDKKDYYINLGFKIKILGAATDQEEQPEQKPEQDTSAPIGKKNFGISQPQNMGLASNKNVGA
jgi:hypothetical protein